MTDSLILVDRKDAVVTVSFNRPKQLNALTTELLIELQGVLDGIAADKSASVVILTGVGRAFSVGVDLKARQVGGVNLTGGDIGSDLNIAARGVIRTLETMPQAVIARVQGFCFTGALEIALAADIIMVDASAKLGDTHATIGIRPTWGMTQRLPRAVGLQRAREMSFTARHITGVEAAEYGLALQACPPEELESVVDELATTIAAQSSGSVAAYKDMYAKSANTGLEEGLEYEFNTEFEIEDTDERMAAMMKRLRG